MTTAILSSLGKLSSTIDANEREEVKRFVRRRDKGVDDGCRTMIMMLQQLQSSNVTSVTMAQMATLSD